MNVLKYFVENVANPILRSLGGEFIGIWRATSLAITLERSARRNLDIATVIDIGASYGKWSMVMCRRYPNAFFFLIEAQQTHEKGLKDFKARYPNSDYLLAAGDKAGEIFFDETDPKEFRSNEYD